MSKAIIIGAGLSGLTAAYYLQKAGQQYQIIEASDRVGGRVKTDHVDGYRMDRGFQVFLTAYPEARKVLDYGALDLRSFDPGAVLLRREGRRDYLGDPLRQISALWPTIVTDAATIADKINIWKTKSHLKRLSIDEIFAGEERTTNHILKTEYGFSDTIISEFLRPFYAGIFLENDLSTSRRMFDFVFKMFSAGDVAVPALGMEEIPKQIASHLDHRKIILDTKVTSIEEDQVVTHDGKVFTAEHIIVATEATGICRDLAPVKLGHRSTTNMYFATDVLPYSQKAIALNGAPDALVNNMVCMSHASSAYASHGHLISVSLKEGADSNDVALIEKVKSELSQWVSSAKGWRHIRTYKIDYALPDQTNISNDQIQIVNDSLTIIGDHTMNGSINAAMKSGRLGAERAIGSLL